MSGKYDLDFVGNENNWLYGGENHPATQCIMSFSKIYKDDMNYCTEYHIDKISEYKQFMDLTSQVVKDISIPNNSFSSSKIIMELIHKGYLSKDNKFINGTDKTYPYIDIVPHTGIDVIEGIGACRHTSGILKAIFEKLNIYNQAFLCYLSDSFISISDAYKKKANHEINIIEHDGVLYGCDTINQEFLYFVVSQTMKYYQSDEFLYYKPSADVLINNLSYQEVITKLDQYKEAYHRKRLSKGELDEIIDETIDRMNQKKSILQDFKKEAKEYTKRISNLK